MSTFTLAISCLTTSNLPWFMDLIFQVPMPYCSLKHQTWLPSPVTYTTGCCFCFASVSSFFLEKAMAPHSSTLAWKISWMEEPSRLQSTGSLRVRHDSATSLSLFTFMHWRRKWQPTPVFLPGESRGQRTLVGCRLWGCTELDMTEVT